MMKGFTCVHFAACCLTAVLGLTGGAMQARGDQASVEDYYRIETIPLPEGVALEASGMTLLPDDRLAVATRRGEVWILSNPYMEDGEQPHFRRFAHGLHEPLGLAYKEGALYAAQRGELTRLRDTNGDGRADAYDTVYDWPQSGNHHAYSYGPRVLPDGRLALAFGLDSPHGGMRRDTSLVQWRGWIGAVDDAGAFHPIATGAKQPAAFGLNADDELFFADHDGYWVAAGYISHVEKGDFLGHPAGLRWKDHPDSPVDMAMSYGDVPSTEGPMYELARDEPAWKLPAVWLPLGILGAGAQNDLITDTTGGRFGPFEGQLFVADYSSASIARVFLEKVDGAYQGVAFPFREGFKAGIVRQAWGGDGSMFIGMTTRGWASGAGDAPHALQRLVWTGEVPFEVKAVRAQPDGFEIEFTRPADPDDLNNPSLYSVRSFQYKYHDQYGSPIINDEHNPLIGVRASDDGTRVRLVVHNPRQYYIHEIQIGELADREGVPLLHDQMYYTLNNIPEGEALALSEIVQAHDLHEAAHEASHEPMDAEVLEGKVTEMPEDWADGPDVTVEMEMITGLRFDRDAFEVPAGSRVELKLENRDDMVHNLVITEPDAADAVGEAAILLGPDGPGRAYVPDSEQVLYYSGILQPDESQTIYFVAPDEPGSYPYVCTIPGHHLVMRGEMQVTPR